MTAIPADVRALVSALAVGAVGGAAFAWLRLPLPWMMGAMCLTTASAITGVRVRVPVPLRMFMVAVLGVMLGSAFRSEMFEQAGEWLTSLSGLAAYVAILAVVTTVYFRRIGGYDRTTAYFSAIPGGLSEMILVGGAMGADDRTIALTHASRILLVVFIVPFWFRLIEGLQPAPGGVGSAFVSVAEIPAFDLLVLAVCGVIGFGLAFVLRIPSPALIGPMALSAAVHVSNVTVSRPPVELIVIAQIVIGTAIGCRFAGAPVRRILHAILVAIGSTALMLGSSVAFAVGLNALTDLPVHALVLAFAPGGLAEMSLIALALGIDPAFVSTHHVVRIFLVVILAPLAYRAFAEAQLRRAKATRQRTRGD
jgi:hypothetical protein